MYDFTECDEIGANMNAQFESFDEALRYVKKQMPDESVTVQDNIAASLVR